MKIKISKIDDSSFAVREKLEKESFKELKESLKEDGQWDPIIVRPKGEKFEVISGHRRVQAAKELGWADIETTVKDVDDTEGLFLALKTNLMHSDMTEREQGKILHKITSELNISQREIAKKLGKDPSWVSHRIKIALDLHPDVVKALEENKIQLRIAEIIATLDMGTQSSFLLYILKNKITDADAVRKAKQRFFNTSLYTIGYEGKSIEDFISILKNNGIEYLIDVRFSSGSQYKPEFSGNILSRELERAKIKYVSKPEFGVPYEWQNPYKDGAIPFECINKYYRWKVNKETNFQQFLDFVKESGKTALMCYEKYAESKRDQGASCHRIILAQIMKESGEFKEVIHL